MAISYNKAGILARDLLRFSHNSIYNLGRRLYYRGMKRGRMLKQLIKLCPTLGRAKDINEPIQRMEKAHVMNGGTLTKNPVKNAINYLLSIQEKHEQRISKTR